MKTNKFILALALSLSFTLAGCGGTTSSSVTSSVGPSSTSSSGTSAGTSKDSSASTESSTSSGPSYAATITSPVEGATLSLVDPIVKQYWDLTVDPFATAANPDASYTLLNGTGVAGHDRQTSKIIFTAQKADTYSVRLSLASDFSNPIDRRAVGSSITYTANLLTLYPQTKYYAEVISSKGEVVSAPISFTTENAPRMLNAFGEYPVNFRDSGGYAVGESSRIRYGMLYRGATIDGLESYGREVMGKELGIKSEIDLRNLGGSTGYQTVNMIDMTHPFYSCPLTGYEHNIGDATWEAGIKALFSAISNKDNYPVYFHCEYGADRTGVAAFLINGLCGVSFSDLTRDFELTSFNTNPQLRTMDTDYGSWIRLYNAIMAKGTSSDSLADCMAKYLLSIGVTQEQIDATKALLVEPTSNAIPNSEYYCAASLKAPCHVSAIHGAVTPEWVEEGGKVTLTTTLLSGSSFTGWSDGTSVVSTDNPYEATINATCTYSAVLKDDADVVAAEKDDLLYGATLDKVSDASDTYEATDTNTADATSRRAWKFFSPASTKTWPFVSIKLANPIKVGSGKFQIKVRHDLGTVDWMSMRFYDENNAQVGSESGYAPGAYNVYGTASFSAPNNSTVAYLRLATNTYDDKGDTGTLFYFDELSYQGIETVTESGTAGATGYTIGKMEDLPLDSGMTKSTISMDYSNVLNSDSLCSIKSVMDATSRTANWQGHIVLNLDDAVKLGNIKASPNAKAGTLEGYFKFSSDIATPLVEVGVAWMGDWAQTSYLEMNLGEADSNGWRKATFDTAALADLYAGTSSDWTGALSRLVFAFGDLAQTGTVWMDELSFVQGDISKYAREVPTETGTRGASGYLGSNLEDLSISSDFHCIYGHDHNVIHAATGSSLKIGYAASSAGYPRVSLETPNSSTYTFAKGTFSGYFKFGEGVTPWASLKMIDTNWNPVKDPSDSSKEAEIAFTLTADNNGDGWYYGTIDVSQFAFAGTVVVFRINTNNPGTATNPYVWVDQLSYSIA